MLIASRNKGFSLIELVGVLAILGILAAIGLSRFADTGAFEARGFADQAAALVRYGQKLAIARHNNIFVAQRPNRLELCLSVGIPCPAGQGAPGPDGTVPFAVIAPQGVVIAATVANFSFDANGRPSQASVLTFTDSGGSRTLTVEAETGYVY